MQKSRVGKGGITWGITRHHYCDVPAAALRAGSKVGHSIAPCN